MEVRVGFSLKQETKIEVRIPYFNEAGQRKMKVRIPVYHVAGKRLALRYTHCAFYAIDNIGGSACEAVGDFNRSLRSCYFVCVVNERASFVSFASAFEGAR